MTREMTAAAVQGLLRCADVWNTIYDEILRLAMAEETFVIRYADNVATVITARNVEKAQLRLDHVMRRIKSWIDDRRIKS